MSVCVSVCVFVRLDDPIRPAKVCSAGPDNRSIRKIKLHPSDRERETGGRFVCCVDLHAVSCGCASSGQVQVVGGCSNWARQTVSVSVLLLVLLGFW